MVCGTGRHELRNKDSACVTAVSLQPFRRESTDQEYPTVPGLHLLNKDSLSSLPTNHKFMFVVFGFLRSFFFGCNVQANFWCVSGWQLRCREPKLGKGTQIILKT